jgi:carboxymethylenebutenolidase
MAGTVTVDVGDGVMALYEAEPEAVVRGGVIVVQEAFGVNGHIESVCQRFAAEGFRAVAPHLFHRSGDPILDYSDVAAVMPHIEAMTREGLTADVDATLDYLASAGIEAVQTGVVGFCMGGTVAFVVAAQHAIGAAVTFYGGGVAQGRFGFPSLIDLAGDLQTPWLGLFGDLDQGIPVDQVESLTAAVADAPVPAEIVRYAEAGHGFHCDGRDSYHQASALDAWSRTLGWFNRFLDAP